MWQQYVVVDVVVLVVGVDVVVHGSGSGSLRRLFPHFLLPSLP